MNKGAAATATTQEKWSSEEKALMVSSVSIITLTGFEALATSTIMPNIVADLHAEAWFSMASGAALAAQLIACVIAGTTVDRHGARRMLIGGMALFAAGMWLSAFAPHVAVFVAGRVIQGLGAGSVVVPLYALVGSVATDRHRATFFAAFSVGWVLPAIVGPAIAGWVAVTFGWRWIFATIPLLGIISAIPIVPLLNRVGHALHPEAPRLGRLPIFALMAGLGVLAIQLSGTQSGALMWGSLAGGLVVIAIFLPALVPHGVFTFQRGIPSVIATRFLALGALTGGTAFLPLILQRVHGWSAAHASIAVTISTVSWALGAAIQARIHEPQLRQRFPMWGTALLTVGLIPVSFLTTQWFPVWIALVGWFISGAGMGITHTTLSDLTLGMSDTSEHGRVSSWLQVADNAGASLELAVTSVILPIWFMTAAKGRAGIPGTDIVNGQVDGFIYIPSCVLAVVVAMLGFWAASHIPTRQPHTRGER